MTEILLNLLNAELDLGFGKPTLWREVIGNGFGLASAILGMRRRVGAWPIGIVGNVVLFTVFLGGVFHTPQDLDLWGQAGRQVFFLIVSVYGWVTWSRNLSSSEAGALDASGNPKAAVLPSWASNRARLQLLGAAIAMWVVFYFTLRALGSWGPAADAWILTGSILATYGMAKGWVEFWLIWIAVDIVGVPLLLRAQYYPSALMYVIYGAFCVVGFVSWWRISRQDGSITNEVPASVTVQGG